jgi:hypothetical protein
VTGRKSSDGDANSSRFGSKQTTTNKVEGVLGLTMQPTLNMSKLTNNKNECKHSRNVSGNSQTMRGVQSNMGLEAEKYQVGG